MDFQCFISAISTSEYFCSGYGIDFHINLLLLTIAVESVLHVIGLGSRGRKDCLGAPSENALPREIPGPPSFSRTFILRGSSQQLAIEQSLKLTIKVGCFSVFRESLQSQGFVFKWNKSFY